MKGPDHRRRLAKEQRLLARFLTDELVERDVRNDPEAAANLAGVDVAIARALAAIEPARVAAFRASMEHKKEVRSGRRRPSRLG